MKRAITSILLTLLLISCSKEKVKYIPTFSEISYFTENTKKPDLLLKEELETKSVVALHYPMFVSESYILIKYINTILLNKGSVSVINPFLEETDEDLLNYITKNNPNLGFTEFLDLYSYFTDKNISFSSNFSSESDFKLVLLPEDYSENTENYLKENFSSSDIITVNMVGLKDNSNLFEIVKKMPERKKFSSCYTEDKKSIIFFMGEVKDYSKVETIPLYTLDNYNTAPEEFLNSKKSLLKNAHVNKMNFYLPDLVDESFTIYGDN